MNSVGGKRKAEKRQVAGSGIQRAEEDKTFGAYGHNMAEAVWVVETRQHQQRLQQR
jgi:hypothetical protein